MLNTGKVFLPFCGRMEMFPSTSFPAVKHIYAWFQNLPLETYIHNGYKIETGMMLLTKPMAQGKDAL